MKALGNSRKFKLYRLARRELAQRFPAAFPRSGRRPTLKVGIMQDIRTHGDIGVSMTTCRRFLTIWTSSTAYLTNMSPGNPRIGLDGTLDGVVTDAHAKEARSTIRARLKNRAKRRNI